MKVLRLADVPPLMDGDKVYRYSRWTTLVPLLLFTAVLVWMVAFNRPPVFGPVFGVLGMLFVLAYSHMATARFSSQNWLVRSTVDGLYIKYRSYLATDYPADEPTVLFVAFSEISSLQIVKERTELPNLTGAGTEVRFRTLVELALSGDTSEARQAIAAELAERAPMVKKWYGKSSTTFDHHPVTFNNDGLVIEWGVLPSAKRFEARLGTRVHVEPLRKESHDLRNLHTENRDTQEAHLIRLVESGRMVDAVNLVRKTNGFDLAQATQFIDGLRRSNNTTEEPPLHADEPARWTQPHKTDADRLPPA